MQRFNPQTFQHSLVLNVLNIGMGTIFRLGEQKLAKNNQDNEIQSITLWNMYFSKNVYAVYNGAWGKAPEVGEFSRKLCLKNLTVCKVTFNCKLREKMGKQECCGSSSNL